MSRCRPGDAIFSYFRDSTLANLPNETPPLTPKDGQGRLFFSLPYPTLPPSLPASTGQDGRWKPGSPIDAPPRGSRLASRRETPD